MKSCRSLILALTYIAADVIAGGACRERPSHSPPPTTTVPPAPPSAPPAPPPSLPAVGALTAKVQPSREALALSDAFANAAAAIRPSVVRLDVEGTGDLANLAESGQLHEPDLPQFLRRFLDHGAPAAPKQKVLVRGTGSGIVIDGKGVVLTDSHVVRGADKVTIKLPDQRAFAGRGDKPWELGRPPRRPPG